MLDYFTPIHAPGESGYKKAKKKPEMTMHYDYIS